MSIDFKNEILENERITVIGNAEMMKQLLFDVTVNEGFELVSNVSIYSKYLALSRVEDILIIEDIQDENGDFIPQGTEILWIDEDILDESYRKGQEDAFLEFRDILCIY
ncbi:hypothetical protein FKF97_11010 [Clostridium perfringens]|nr:hypothetical protein [Clostridium perfringens]